jgi:hypothetical protein
LCRAWSTLLALAGDERERLGRDARRRIVDHYSVELLAARTGAALAAVAQSRT